MLQTLPALDVFDQYPWVVVVLALLIRGGVAYQRGLSWYEYRTWHGLRRQLFPILQRYVPVVRFVNVKPDGRDSDEYIATVDTSVRETAAQLRQGGGMYHLISSIKRRPEGHGDTLTRAHVVWLHDSGDQTECYLFANDDGTVDVYAHYEAAVTDPDAHLSEYQTQGDPRGMVRSALGVA